MITDPHHNLILSRFTLAAALNQAAHHFDLAVTTSDAQKNMNNMIVKLLLEEGKKIEQLALYELNHESR